MNNATELRGLLSVPLQRYFRRYNLENYEKIEMNFLRTSLVRLGIVALLFSPTQQAIGQVEPPPEQETPPALKRMSPELLWQLGRLGDVAASSDGNLIAYTCLLYTSPSPRDRQKSRMPSSA